MVVDDYIYVEVSDRQDHLFYKVNIKYDDLTNINFLKKYLKEDKNYYITKCIYFDVKTNKFIKLFSCFEQPEIRNLKEVYNA